MVFCSNIALYNYEVIERNRWILELNEGAIFEQNTISNICLSIKM